MSMFGDVGLMARNGMKRMMNAREAQARRYVSGALLSMDDELLARAGYNREDLRKQYRSGVYSS